MTATGPRYLTTDEAASYCRYPNAAHLVRAEALGLIRACMRGRTPLWRREDLDHLRSQEPLLRLGSFVYFIEAVGADRIKIGFARSPALRMSELATGSPFPLRLLGMMVGGYLEEQELHERFKSQRAHGEWFAASAALRVYVAEHAGAQP